MRSKELLLRMPPWSPPELHIFLLGFKIGYARSANIQP